MTARAPEPAWRTLHFALLGLLGQGPATGYELSQLMRRPLGYYWRESQGQIYPALAALERAGWTEVDTAPGRGPRGRRVHRMTPAGRTALGSWAAEPAQDQAPRDELVVKVSALWAADPAAARRMLAGEQQRHVERQRTYESILARMEARDAEIRTRPDRPEFWARQTLVRGVDYERDRAEWCRRLADEIGAPEN